MPAQVVPEFGRGGEAVEEVEVADRGEVSSCLAIRYSVCTVHTRTPRAQLLPVLATVFGSDLSTMIIISTAVHLDAHGAGSPDGDLRQGRGAQQA